jgi:hypothetical protein
LFFGVGLFPGVVLGVEGFAGLPDGEDEMQEFAHHVPDRHAGASAAGEQPTVQGSRRRVVLHGRQGGVPEILAYQIVPLAGHVHGTGWYGLAEPVHSGAVLLREDAEVGHQRVGGGEAIDIYDLGGEHRSRGIADSWDRCDGVG